MDGSSEDWGSGAKMSRDLGQLRPETSRIRDSEGFGWSDQVLPGPRNPEQAHSFKTTNNTTSSRNFSPEIGSTS
ncbi:hypothetical protein quinque_005967 [Culex quinquefasciatus]